MSKRKEIEVAEDIPEEEQDMDVESEEEGEDLFAEVRKNANKPQGRWKAMNTIIAAVDDVLATQQVLSTEAPTTYFTAFLSALESEKQEQNASALIELQNTIINRIPTTFLRAQYAFLSTLVTNAAERFTNSQSVLRPLLTFATSVLLAQDADFWSRALAALESGVPSKKRSTKTQQEDIESLVQIPLLNLIFGLVTDARPNVRKRSHNCIYLLISSGRSNVSKYCSYQLSQIANKVLSACDARDYHASLHLMGLLKVVLPYMSSSLVTAVSRMMLRLPALSHSFISLQTYQAFGFLFSSDEDNLPAASLAFILKGLHDIDTNRSDVKLTIAYTNMMTQGLIKLYKLDRDACMQRLPLYFAQTMLNFQCEPEAITLQTRQTMKKVIKACIDDQLITESLPSAGKAKAKATTGASTSAQQGVSALEAIISELEKALGYKTKGNVDLILDVQATLFKRLGSHSYPLLVGLVQIMEQLHATKDFHFQSSLERAMGAAVQSMGPEKFLSIIPLTLDDEEGRPNRQWLLPILRNNILHTELAFFIRYIMPLAKRLLAKSTAALQAERPIEAKNVKRLYEQLWSLLPGFCTYPTDLPQSFKMIAKDLGAAIKDDVDTSLRGVVCASLLRLINKNKSIVDGAAEKMKLFKVTTEQAEANIKAVAVFSRNFLPILFNTFAHETLIKRGILADAITAFASITDKKLLNELFMTLLTKIAESITAATETASTSTSSAAADGTGEQTAQQLMEQARDRKCSMTELASALSPSLEDETISFLYRIIMPNFQDQHDTKLQKISYKALESLAIHHPQYINTHAKEIFRQLSQVLAKCLSSSKKYRLSCFAAMVNALEDKDKLAEYLPQVLGEVITCIKEVNTKTRVCAYDMIIGLAKQYAFGSHNYDMASDSDDEADNNDADENDGAIGKVNPEQEELLQQFFTSTLAGLGGNSSMMISSTVVALSRLLFEFHVYIEPVLPNVLNSVLLLVQHQNKEIVVAVLGFIKVCIVILSNDFLIKYLPSLIPALLYHSSRPQSGELHQTIKVVFERLLRKFGFEEVEKHFPEEHKKFIRNIRKEKKRKDAQKSKMTKAALALKDQQKGQNGRYVNKRGSKKGKKHVDYEDAIFGDDDEGVESDNSKNSKNNNNRDDDGDSFFTVKKGGSSSSYNDVAPSKKKAKFGNGELSMIHESDEPLNLLDPMSINKMVSSRPKKQKSAKDSKDAAAAAGKPGFESGFKLDKKTGKFIINESDDDDDGEELLTVSGSKTAASGSASAGKRGAKRGRDNKDEDILEKADDEDRMPLGIGLKDDYMDQELAEKNKEVSARANDAATAIAERRFVRAKRAKRPEVQVQGLDQFKPKDKRTGGDVKRGGVDPFAYIPLDPRALNKRVKNQTFNKFEKDTRKSRKSTAASQKAQTLKSRTKDAKSKGKRAAK